MKLKGIAVVLAASVSLSMLVACGNKNADMGDVVSNAVASTDTVEAEENNSIEFPYELENGKLLVKSLFQASVENPDCSNEIGEDIASLEITNQSEEFCTEAAVKVVMQDGTELSFMATNIPAGKTVWAFSTSNQSVAQEDVCRTIECTAEFGENTMMEDRVQCSVEDTTITVLNLTNEELNDLSIYCHCLFEDAYFGGVTYCYPVENLPAGESVTIEADDCYMGTAEVVSIKKDN